MNRKRLWLPASLVIAGLSLIIIALIRPSSSPQPVAHLDTTNVTAESPRPDLTRTSEAAIIATNQQFFVPTTTAAPAVGLSVTASTTTHSTTEPAPGADEATRRPYTPVGTPVQSQTLEPGTVVPYTATPTPSANTPAPTHTGNPSGTLLPSPTASGAQLSPPGYLSRFGLSGSMSHISNAAIAGLPFGSYLNWGTSIDPARPNGAQFWQMVRVNAGGLRLPGYDRVNEVIAAQPGAVWVIGNEPDVIVQDNVNPERYAEIYHDLYHYIKARDPSAIIAIAGVAQPTPLRRAYLDRVLSHYQNSYGSPMPIDIWTIHGFIFREEAGNWGAGIPPGMGVSQGTLYTLEDHANLDIFRQNLLDFRRWLAGHGYQETPLAVTEYGVVMPEEYGFPPELVQEFLVASFNFFLSANNGTGWSADGGRLFQYWFWYSVHDDFFATPNLYDPTNNVLTPLGDRYAQYVRG